MSKLKNKKTNSSLVSIIIPVYNVKPYLTQALDSVINQTYDNLEIIIIDDGSTDGSETTCDYYMIDPRVRVIHQDNRGLSAARNVGLNFMNGDMLAFLDPDDIYHLDFINLLLSAINDNESDIAICKYTYNLPNGKKIKKSNTKLKHGEYNAVEAQRLLADGLINVSVWNKMYRKELWDNIRFPEGRIYEDIITTYKVFNRSKKVCVIDRYLYIYRIREGSLSRRDAWENISDKLVAYAQVDSFIAQNVPNVFSQEQVDKRKKRFIEVLLGLYVRFHANNSEDEKNKKELRGIILRAGKETNFKKISFHTKLAYFLLWFQPRLLQYIYSLYSILKKWLQVYV